MKLRYSEMVAEKIIAIDNIGLTKSSLFELDEIFTNWLKDSKYSDGIVDISGKSSHWMNLYAYSKSINNAVHDQNYLINVAR